MVTLTIFTNGEAADFAWALFSLLSVNNKVLFRVYVCATDRRDSGLERELKKTGNTKESTVDSRGELSYLAPLGSENISAPYFKQCFFGGWGYYPPPQTESNTTPPSPKTEITNILFYILNFASIIKFKM